MQNNCPKGYRMSPRGVCEPQPTGGSRTSIRNPGMSGNSRDPGCCVDAWHGITQCASNSYSFTSMGGPGGGGCGSTDYCSCQAHSYLTGWTQQCDYSVSPPDCYDTETYQNSCNCWPNWSMINSCCNTGYGGFGSGPYHSPPGQSWAPDPIGGTGGGGSPGKRMGGRIKRHKRRRGR